MGELLFVVMVVGGLIAFFYRQNQLSHGAKTAPPQTVCCATRVSPEEPAAEETVAEETVAEETVAEETVAEETVAEETAAEEVPQTYDALTWRVLQRVMEQPGILQTEIYGMFPRENRKHLQATLLQLDKENVLKREKEGNTYRLFPV